MVNSSTAVKSLSRQCRGFACKTDSASRGRRLAASSETFNFLGAVRISLVNSSTAVKSLSRQCRGFACKTDSASRGGGSPLKYNANQTVTTLIDNAFNSFLEFIPCISWHTIKLVVQTFVDKLVQRFSENI